jgi:hypothetical protein
MAGIELNSETTHLMRAPELRRRTTSARSPFLGLTGEAGHGGAALVEFAVVAPFPPYGAPSDQTEADGEDSDHENPFPMVGDPGGD